MAKTHQVSKSGALLALVLGATALSNSDDLTSNVSALGQVAGEIVCTVADLTGGIVVLPGGNCTATPAANANGAAATGG